MSEHDRIWLEPSPGDDEDYGRQWCQHNVWDDGVEYVRSDLSLAPVATLTEWKQSIINVCKGCGSDNLPWAGDKTGWGFIYYFIQHLHTRATTAEADIATATEDLTAERDRLREENERLRAGITEAVQCLDGEPEYHHSGMGCGLEDRNITDRYDAMEHGWECALERVYGEHINGAREILAALSPVEESK